MSFLRRMLLVLALGPALCHGRLRAIQDPPKEPVPQASDSVLLRFVDADLRGIFQALGRYLSKPLVSSGVPGERVTFDYPRPVAISRLPGLLRSLAEAHNLELVEEETHFRLGPRRTEAAEGPPAAAITEAVPQESVELFVIRLKHTRAADVAATVNLLFGGGGVFSGRSSLTEPSLSQGLRRDNVPPVRTQDSAQGVTAEQQAVTLATIRGPTTVVPDEISNSLLIRASRSDFEVLSAAVNQIDVRPLQVLIEVLIVEARRDRSFELGAALSSRYTEGDHQTRATLTGAGAGDLVLQFLKMGRHEVNAILSMAQSRGEVQIVSRPVLVTSNNVEAYFLVGSQRPFVQVSRSLPTETATRDQVVQYRDVGTKLTVLPTINGDGYVSLLIQQEISAATNETQFDAPVISTREARTQLLVRDGQTLVIGGLTDEQRTRTRTGVPILSGIPVLGGLFGRSSKQRSTTELFLFLTPRILRTDADADSVTAPRLPPQGTP